MYPSVHTCTVIFLSCLITRFCSSIEPFPLQLFWQKYCNELWCKIEIYSIQHHHDYSGQSTVVESRDWWWFFEPSNKWCVAICCVLRLAIELCCGSVGLPMSATPSFRFFAHFFGAHFCGILGSGLARLVDHSASLTKRSTRHSPSIRTERSRRGCERYIVATWTPHNACACVTTRVRALRDILCAEVRSVECSSSQWRRTWIRRSFALRMVSGPGHPGAELSLSAKLAGATPRIHGSCALLYMVYV